MRVHFAARAGAHGTLAVGAWRGRKPTPSLAALAPDGSLLRALKRLDFDADAEETVLLAAPGRGLDALVVAGLGSPKKLSAKRLRAIGGAIWDELDDAGHAEAWLALDLAPDQLAELAYGLMLKSYQGVRQYRTRYDSDDEEEDFPTRVETVTFVTSDPTRAERLFRPLEQVALGVFLARDLTFLPANALGPAEFVAEARKLEELGVEVNVLELPQLKAQGLNLLAAVGQGSARPPALAVLRWKGSAGKPAVLVGKGITFDTGGISIKFDDEDMDCMKGDMGGAAAVIGAIRALAGRRAQAHVCGVLALAENMVSGGAQRPGDVLVSYSGQTVEVIDTDAEGRLVLADALAWSAANLDPALMIDIATLTGSVEEVLGDPYAGLYANDDRLARRLLRLSKAESEPLWRLPLTQSCDEDVKSDIADMKNCAWGDVPDNDDAARFLSRFVPDGIPWAHIDMAGKEWADEDDPLCPETATGFGVRLFNALAP
jgi:leucyl aminopeptidase